jgi:hypothetical protein
MANDTRHQLERVQERLQAIRAANRSEPMDSWDYHEEMVGLLVTVTESVKNSTELRGQEHTQIIQQIATLEANVKHIHSDISILCKLVRDGNGQPSIIQRLANLETVVKNQIEQIHEVEVNANSILASKYLTKTQIVAGLSGMIITALLSAMALFAALMKP